jgi:hypothetical protein
MSETSTTASLVGSPDMFAASANAITATIPRDEIEEALASEPPANLVLDVVRAKPGGEGSERRTVNVTWTQDDLRALLDVDGDAITFYFDSNELERVLAEGDVEAHGLREKAAVLSIAAAAAVGTAGSAFAQPDPGGAGSAQASVVHDEASLTQRGIGISPVHDEASLAERGISVEAAATHDEAGLAARGIEPGTLPATHDEAGLAARGIEPGTLPAVHDEATLAQRGVEHLAATHDEATLTSRGIEPGSVPAIHDEGTLVTRGIVPDTPAAVGAQDTGFELPSVDSGTAAAVTGGLAGAALLIVAASFATRRRVVGHP